MSTKCDLTRPCCERCLKGGYECLGYNDEETRENSPQDDPNVLVSSRLEHDALAIPVLPERPEPSTLEIDPKELLKFKNILHDGQQYFDSTCENPDLSSSIFGPAILYGMVGSIPWADDNYIGTHTLDYNIYSRSQRQDQFTTYGPLDKVSNLHAEYGESRLSTIIRALFSSIPPSIDATHIMRDGHIVHVIGEYQVQRVRNWFTIPSPSVRDYLITRVKGSKAMVGAMYLGAKLFQAVGENPGGTGVLKCIGWIEKLEQRFDNDFYSSSTLNEAGDYLLAELELAFLKSSIISSISGYSVLQKVLPRFLHLLAADPSLYSEGSSGSLVVSFPRTFGASRFELKRFVMFDTTATLVLGVPPLVEYGYDGECDPVAHALEFIHGAPVVFVETIAQVNSWRVGSRVPLDDWWILEKRVMDWQAQPLVGEEEEPTIESVAKLAVQESWRQVALIYIYMGICGVSSHDTRVQASIRQIIQLGEVVADLPIGVHMFVHCVVAGLGARYERHRAIVRKKLLSFEGLRVWLFRGHDFTQILDHLWHGVGADGAPVTWDDYVRSRCVVAPL